MVAHELNADDLERELRNFFEGVRDNIQGEAG